MPDEEYTRRIIQEAVLETLRGIGFNTGNPLEIQADLLYLHKMRKGSEEMSRLVKRSVVTIALPGVVYMVWEAFKQAIRYH